MNKKNPVKVGNRQEKCANPWRSCDTTDIYCYITDARLPICRDCWTWICDNEKEW